MHERFAGSSRTMILQKQEPHFIQLIRFLVKPTSNSQAWLMQYTTLHTRVTWLPAIPLIIAGRALSVEGIGSIHKQTKLALQARKHWQGLRYAPTKDKQLKWKNTVKGHNKGNTKGLHDIIHGYPSDMVTPVKGADYAGALPNVTYVSNI